MKLRAFLALSLLSPACAGPQTSPSSSASPPAAAVSAADPTTFEGAKIIVADFQRRHSVLPADHGLRSPKSLDDVLAILKSDQIELFEGGIQFAKTSAEPHAKALQAQMELAWGDACIVLADILWETAARLRPTLRAFEMQAAAGKLGQEQQERHDELRRTVADYANVATALMRFGDEHLVIGASLTRAVIDGRPDHYAGYRVAADYYRMRQDWEAFEGMVAKITAHNPDSNGLLFAQATAAADRDGDRTRAAELFRQALSRDPEFARARAYLVLWADSAQAQYEAYQSLKEANPTHQIVVWAGKGIEAAQAR